MKKSLNKPKVNYDKVWFKRKVKFPTSIASYEFKIVEIDGEFYIYIDDRHPHWGYSGRTGPFSSFEVSLQVLKEDLGGNFPSLKNNLRKQFRNLNGPVGCLIGVTGFAIYVTLALICFQFIDGGLDAIGFDDDENMISVFLFGALHILIVYKFTKKG